MRQRFARHRRRPDLVGWLAILVCLLGGCIGSGAQHDLSAGSDANGEGSAATVVSTEDGGTSDSGGPVSSDGKAQAGGDAPSEDESADPAAAPSGDAAAVVLTPFDNFHPIAKGRAYRSGQLPAEKLKFVIETYGIKTVVNLRGPNAGSEWYDEEKAACAAAGVRMVDVPLSAGALPPRAHVLTLYDLFQDATAEPLLIHCRGGADRSGMISAMWRMEVLGDNRETALRELNWLYGHFPARYPSMTEFIRMFEPSRAWIEQEYNPAGGGEMTDD